MNPTFSVVPSLLVSIITYHYIREAVASGVLVFTHIPGSINPADILSKHWGYQQVWSMLRPLLFWSGDTLNCIDYDRNNTEGSNTVAKETVEDQSSPDRESVTNTNGIESTHE